MAHLEGTERANYVQNMFAGIAGNYDTMNRLMTFGQDMKWRRTVVELARIPKGGRLLDIATGTGDIAAEALGNDPTIQSVGGDFTIEMMAAGKADYPERKPIQWVGSDTLRLPFPDNYFDAVTSGFLMRNVIDVEGAFKEQMRVTKPGGRVVVLETSPPKDNLLKPFILIHLNYILPTMGRLIAGSSEAYTYLPDSTKMFKTPDALAFSMRQLG
ncbi:MAG: ubiquinone/menaquinone biosynthesis methyltransferase, partial [Chloroflexota bacterium]